MDHVEALSGLDDRHPVGLLVLLGNPILTEYAGLKILYLLDLFDLEVDLVLHADVKVVVVITILANLLNWLLHLFLLVYLIICLLDGLLLLSLPVRKYVFRLWADLVSLSNTEVNDVLVRAWLLLLLLLRLVLALVSRLDHVDIVV